MEAATLFQALVKVESNSLPQAPQRAVARTYPAVPQQNNDIELRPLARPSARPSVSGVTTPRDLEMSVPNTPGAGEQPDDPLNAFEVLPGISDPPMNRFRLAVCCTQNLLMGLVDSAPGALIPYIEKHYGIGYAIVSLIFIGNALGFIAAAPFVDAIRMRLGRAKTCSLAALCLALGFIPLLAAAPFPAIVVGYFFIGFGSAINLAIGNVFTANLKNGTVFLGIQHGSYGVGGTVGPLIATSIVSRLGAQAWNKYYLLTISFSVANAAFYLWSFWNYENETSADTALSQHHAGETASSPRTELGAMLGAFQSRAVLLGATFIFAYQGAEVSISGWVISFLIATRNGDPTAVGNVTSGFWGGITLGRFLLSPVGARVGEKRFVYFLTVGAAVFQLLVWFVPNIIGEAVSLAIVGLLLGPIYPCAATVFMRNLSRQEQVSGLGVISAFGSSGGAVAPFTTGLLAQAAGTFVLHPIAIGLFGAMLVCWFILPATRKRTE
ncbi:major facilitator superfamily transporter [Xylaria bambusicola]|uniref:major facilitator superfamily transporter n=1 Tax=Xylaria bambusicola TaxID=326684 RepID=UPI002008DDB2|nr:major facilitator superfamily transporter [Xylaria bambusicola]KAI0521307.1 major facilitator superfamily transporter [Xylaria bambusicola]